MAMQQFKGNSNMPLLHMGSAFSLFLVQFSVVVYTSISFFTRVY